MKKIKIVLVSDNHGMRECLAQVRKMHADADYFMHCGDSSLPGYLMEGFATVKGNNDYYGEYPLMKVLHVGEHVIYLTHGHCDMFMRQYKMLADKARSFGCDLCFFGHTHIPLDTQIDGVRLLNPGSICFNRDGSEPSYMIVTLEGKSVEAKLLRYQRIK